MKKIDQNTKNSKTEKEFIKEREQRKTDNMRLTAVLEDKKERLEKCSELIGVTTIDGLVKQSFGSHCNCKLCPICSRRREMKTRAKLFQIMPKLKDTKYSFIYAVFTVRNCDIQDLRNTVKEINRGFDRLYKLTPLRNFKGYFRSLEITRNPETNEAHPHINVIFAVSKNYFTNKDYIKKADWVKMWQDVMKLNYEPNTFVKKIELTEADLLEVLKYSVKTTDMLEASKTWITELDKQMKGMRLNASGGIFKKLLKEVTDQYKDENLMPTEDEDYNVETEQFYQFKGNKYKPFKATREITDENGEIKEVPLQMRKPKPPTVESDPDKPKFILPEQQPPKKPVEPVEPVEQPKDPDKPKLKVKLIEHTLNEFLDD